MKRAEHWVQTILACLFLACFADRVPEWIGWQWTLAIIACVALAGVAWLYQAIRNYFEGRQDRREREQWENDEVAQLEFEYQMRIDLKNERR